MKKSRLIVTLMLVALLVTSIAIPAMATTQTPDYEFRFQYNQGELCDFSDNCMYKETASQWMIDVRETNTRYDVTYAMLWTLYSDWEWCVGSRTEPHRGTGVVIGDYVDASAVIDWPFWAGAMIDTDDLNINANIRGYWNTDCQ